MVLAAKPGEGFAATGTLWRAQDSLGSNVELCAKLAVLQVFLQGDAKGSSCQFLSCKKGKDYQGWGPSDGSPISSLARS